MIKWEKHRKARNTRPGGSLQTDAGMADDTETADDFGMAYDTGTAYNTGTAYDTGTADNTETDNNTRMMLFEKKSADRFQSQAVHAVTGF